MNASYIANIPQAGDVLNVKPANSRAMPCHVWKVKREDPEGVSDASRWCLKKVESFLPKNAHMNGVTMSQVEFLDKMSVHPVDPVFASLRFAAMHQSMNE